MAALVKRLEQIALALAVVCVAAIMLVVCVDTTGRYFFSKPLPWSFEVLSYYLMVVAAYFALSSTFQNGDHIYISLLHERLSPKTRAYIDAVCGLIAAFVFAAIVYANIDQTLDAFHGKQFYPGYVMYPVWLSYLPIAIGSALLVLRLVHHSYMLAAFGADPEVLHGGEGNVE